MVRADYEWAYCGDQVEASDDDVVGGHERADKLYGAGGAGLQSEENEGGAQGREQEEIDDGHDVEGAERDVSGDEMREAGDGEAAHHPGVDTIELGVGLKIEFQGGDDVVVGERYDQADEKIGCGKQDCGDAFCELRKLGGERSLAAGSFEPLEELGWAADEEKESGAEDRADAEDEPVAEEILRPIVADGEACGLQGKGKRES